MLTSFLALVTIGQSALPSKPVTFARRDLDGVIRQVPEPGSKATVVVLLMSDCPIANRLAPEVARICSKYEQRGVAFRLIYVDTEDGPARAASHLKTYGYSCPALTDPDHALAKRLGATVSPEAVVVDSKGRMAYRGRINDLYEGHAKPKPKPTVHDLRNALDEVLAGKRVSNPSVGAVGCYIEPPEPIPSR